MAAEGLVSFRVVHAETDLHVSACRNLSEETGRLVQRCRADLESFIRAVPVFAETFQPLEVPSSAPQIVKEMAAAALAAGVGPMAAVAGAVADQVGLGLSRYCNDVIVENGGDIFVRTTRRRKARVFAGSSPIGDRVSIVIDPSDGPLGLCTSSATVGHSVSLGRADAAVVLAKSAALADAAASAVGNAVRAPDDVEDALELGLRIDGVLGVIVVIGETLGVKGKVEIA
ncbi:MAG: UPF0280 family protein [Actinobacteria bacterium]|nr:MAG: UPF0280 family protein [Actinomycetota bacterium]